MPVPSLQDLGLGRSPSGGIFYALVHVKSDGTRLTIGLPPVTNIEVDRQSAIDFQWTLGNEPQRHHSGIREQSITLRGLTGLRPILANGDSQALKDFVALEAFLSNYEGLSSKTEGALFSGQKFVSRVAAVNKSHLRFHALWEGHAHKVEPIQFQWRRAVGTSRFTYEWTLRLRSYAQIDDKFILPDADDPSFLGGLAAFQVGTSEASRSSGIGWLDTINEWINQDVIGRPDRPPSDASGMLGVLDSLRTAKKAVFNVKFGLHNILRPIRIYDQWARTISAIAGEALDISRFPERLVEDYYRAATSTLQAVADVAEVAGIYLGLVDGLWSNPLGDAGSGPSPAVKAGRDNVLRIMWGLGKQRRAALVFLGATNTVIPDWLAIKPLETFSPDNIPERGSGSSNTAVVFYTVVQGDTLESIAIKSGLDRSGWKSIARLNNLPFSKFLADGPLSPGDKLYVPSPAEGGGYTLTKGDPEYGVDIQLDADGDILVAGDEAVDVSRISGVPLLVQALTVRLQTVEGDHATFPQYGLTPLVGEKGSLQLVGLAGVSAREQLLRDLRVKRVDQVEVLDGGDTLEVRSRVGATLGQTLTVAATYPN